MKAYDGREKGLEDKRVMDAKRADETKFKAQVMANPQWKAAYGNAWDQIAGAEKKVQTRFKEQYFHGLNSSLANLAQQIVQYVAEIKKPDGERLAGYHESQLESLRLRMFSPAPIYPDMEIARITGALELDLAEVGPNDPWVKLVMNGKSPREVATELVNGTKLADPEVRKKLVEGGESAVAASTDSMIVLARKLDPMRRELDQVARRQRPERGAARRRTARQGALRGVRQIHLSRRDLHAAPFLRPGEGLSDERNHRSAHDDHVSGCTTGRPASATRTRSICPSVMSKAATSWISRRPSISSPPTILSAATPARR